MQMQYQIKETDGLANSTEAISWQPYKGSHNDFSAIPDSTLLKVNIPNINFTNDMYYPFKSSSDPSFRFLMLEPSTNTWENKYSSSYAGFPEVGSTKGCKIVVIPATGNTVDIYVAKDNAEYNLIPNISTKMRTETYISSDINSSSYSTYRQWGKRGSVNLDNYIPLTFFNLQNVPQAEGKMVAIVVRQVMNQGVATYRWGYVSILTGTTTQDGTDDGLLPTISTHYYSASDSPSQVQDLDSRVTALENEIEKLQDRMDMLEQQIKNIPELIAWTNEAVSKHYVAR